MNPRDLAQQAWKFRLAVDARDFDRAQKALGEYIALFRSGARTLQEVEEARSLLEWGSQVAKAHKAQMAEELMLLKRVSDAYRPAPRAHNWRVDG